MAQAAKKVSAVWIWVLIVVIVLLIAGGVVGFIMFTRPQANQLTSGGNGSAVPAQSNQSLQDYLGDARTALELLRSALENFDEAEAAGQAADIPASNNALTRGLSDIASADAKLNSIAAPSEASELQSLLEEAAQKARASLEKALEGNYNEDVEAISQAQDLATEARQLMDQARQEFESITS